MKHTSTIIRGDDLVGALADYDSGDAADCLGVGDLSEVPDNSWWHVSWPEHVSIARFNSDANYHSMESLTEARDYDPTAEDYRTY